MSGNEAKLETIGQRAAYAVYQRCVQERTKRNVQLKKLGISNTDFWRWEQGDHAPSAYFLQKMAQDGYDIHWILTGEKHD